MSSNVFDLLGQASTLLYLAPQAGVSESPFRRLCRRFGADVLVSEFVSAAGIVMGNRRSRDFLRFHEAERPIGIQIFGAEPDMMADAAAQVADVYKPDFIDINFGCPVKKVVKRNGGSGCLRDLDLVERIIRAVDDATPLPTTVKIRSGFNEATREPATIALRCQEAGARALCLHPRTRADMYSGQARWSEIAEVVEALAIGFETGGGQEIALFLVLQPGLILTDELRTQVRRVIRSAASPRHVPARIEQVPALPRTMSGKVSEIAVRDTIMDEPVRNLSALANPEVLDDFRRIFTGS